MNYVGTDTRPGVSYWRRAFVIRVLPRGEAPELILSTFAWSLHGTFMKLVLPLGW